MVSITKVAMAIAAMMFAVWAASSAYMVVVDTVDTVLVSKIRLN